jgi:hypothetical protein
MSPYKENIATQGEKSTCNNMRKVTNNSQPPTICPQCQHTNNTNQTQITTQTLNCPTCSSSKHRPTENNNDDESLSIIIENNNRLLDHNTEDKPNNITITESQDIKEMKVLDIIGDMINNTRHNTPTINTTETQISPALPSPRRSPVPNPKKGDCHNQKTPGSFRFMTQNIRGLHPKNQVKWEGILERIKALQVDVVGLSETNINWGNAEVTKKFTDTIYKKTQGGSLTLSPIQTSYTRAYLPGGTLTLTIGKWRSHLDSKKTDSDHLGRWKGNSYRLSEESKLHIITAYRVCEAKAKSTSSLTVYNQQYIGLLAMGVKTPDPRQQVINDLILQIKKLKQSDNDYILLGLDANADILNDKNGLIKICTECDMVDMYTSIHDKDEKFPTHINGSKRIDYILCSPNLLRFVN